MKVGAAFRYWRTTGDGVGGERLSRRERRRRGPRAGRRVATRAPAMFPPEIFSTHGCKSSATIVS